MDLPPPFRGVKIKPPTEPSPPFKGVKIKPPTKRLPPMQNIKIAPPSFKYPVNLELDKQRYNVKTILQCSNATPIRTHYVGSGYVCCFCKGNFLKAADLKTHTLQDHDDETRNKFMHGSQLFKLIVKLDITSLSCNICSAATDTLEQLIDHLNTSHQKGLHTDIRSHIACFKLDGEAMRCHICTVEYQSFKLLQEHMNSHYRNFICDVCGAGFINQRQLLSHSNAHNLGAYKCGTCDKIFNTSLKLKTHMRQTHTGILLHKCHQCNERFKTKISKKNHIKEAHGVVFANLQCEACDKTFKSHAGLRVHLKRDHLMERPYKCEICDYSFFTAGLLKEHQVTHTGTRDFKCDVCSKSYSRKYTLKEHMRSHTGDRRFKCTYCDMAFLQKCSLKGHLRSRHDAELEYASKKPAKKYIKKKKVIVIKPEVEVQRLKLVTKKLDEMWKHQVNIRTILACTNATPIRKYANVGYMCGFCEGQFPEPGLLKSHTRRSHGPEIPSFTPAQTMSCYVVKLDITDLHCNLCEARFTTVEGIASHLAAVHNKTYHSDIKSHIIPFQFHDDEFRCVICAKLFGNFKILLQHMNEHFRNFVCDICGKGYVNRAQFSTHMYRHSRGVFGCSFCSKVFDTRVKWREHERATHVFMNKRSKCGYCGERFRDYAKKHLHEVEAHGAKRVVLHCGACDKSFGNQRALSVHTKAYHLMERKVPK